MKPEKSPGFCSHPERRERVSWSILWDGLVFLRIFAWIVKFWCLVWLQLSSECLLTHARTCISSAGVQWSQLYLCLQILWARHWQPSSGCPTAPELHVTIIIINNNFFKKIYFLLFPVPLISFPGSILQPVLDVCVLPVLGTVPAPWSAAPSGDVPGVCTALHCSPSPSVSLLPDSSVHPTIPSMAAPPGAVGEGIFSRAGNSGWALHFATALFFYSSFFKLFFYFSVCLPNPTELLLIFHPSLLMGNQLECDCLLYLRACW